MSAVLDARAILFDGALLTIQLFLAAACLTIVMSIVAGVLRESPVRWIRWAVVVYVETFRGTSVVVQMFWIYFALPSLGLKIDAFPTAIVALGLCFGAYGSEVVRGAIAAVPKEQYEAAIALNMRPLERLRSVVLPQAFIVALPPYTNILVLLLKSTAAASLITIPELTFRATALNQITYQTTWIFGTILVVYFLLASIISKAMRGLETRCSRWRRPIQSASPA